MVFVFILNSIVYSQVSPPEMYLGIGGFKGEGLEKGVYIKFTAGSELFSYKFIAPEIAISFYGGAHKEGYYNDLGFISSQENLNTIYKGAIIGFGSKFYYQEEFSRWVFIPKYNYGNITSEGVFLDSNEEKSIKKVTKKINFWSSAIGIETHSLGSTDKLGVYLIYSGFNSAKPFSSFEFEDQENNTSNRSTVGISIRYSTNFKKEKEKIPY